MPPARLMQPSAFNPLSAHILFISIQVIRPDSLPNIIEKQAEDPLPSGGGMNAVPTAIELEAK